MQKISYKILKDEDFYNLFVDYDLKDPYIAFKDIAKRIKYFNNQDIIPHYWNGNATYYYICAFSENKVIGILKFKTGGQESIWNKGYKNWICFCSVDEDYRGKGIASKLSKILFAFAKGHSYNVLSSGYSEIGFLKLKPLFAKYAEQYKIDWCDNHTEPEFD